MTHDPDDPSPPDLVEPAPDDTFRRILWFMEQARLREIRIGPFLRVGDVTVQIKDVRQARLLGGQAEPEEMPEDFRIVSGMGDRNH